MDYQRETKQQLIEEIELLRGRVADLEAREAVHRNVSQALAESEQRFKKLSEKAIVGVYRIQDHRFRYVNPKMAEIFGYTVDEMQDKLGPQDVVHADDWPLVEANLKKRVTGDIAALKFQFRGVRKDCQTIYVEVYGSRSDEGGRPAIFGTLLDITDRKRAEEKIRESEEKYRSLYAESERSKERYRTLLDVSPDPIIVYDTAGIPSYVNSAFTRVFGWTFEELAGKKTDFVPEESWPETQWMIDTVMGGERFSGQETRRYTKDGRVIDVSISGAPFFGENGKPTGSVVHLRDITARKMAEATKAADLKKFQALYDLALAMTAEHSLEENLSLIVEKSRALLSADKAFLALRDEKANELFMHTLSGIVTDEFKALRIPMGVGMGGRVAQTGKLDVVEDYFKEVGPAFHDVVRAEGLLSGIAVPLQIGKTNVGVLYVFNRTKTPFSKVDLDTLSMLGNLAAVEITRKRAQEKLRESEEKFRKLYEEAKRREELYVSLLNSSADAVVIYDMEGRAQYVSPSFTKIFGWTMEEVADRRIPYLPDEEAERTMKVIMSLIQDGTPCSEFETKRFTKDGRLLDISISSSRYRDHTGEPAGILATLRDISDRKRAEVALRESEERFRTLAEVAPFGIVVIGPDERTHYINPTFSALFGYTIGDVPDVKTWFLKAYRTDKSRSKAEIVWRAEREELKLRHGIGAGAEPRIFKIRCKDGGSRIVSFRAVVLADGRTIATFLDVTAEVEAQQEVIRAKNEWERTFNSVSDLIMILNSRREIVRVNRAITERLGLAPDELIGTVCEMSAEPRGLSAFCPDTSMLSEGKELSAEVSDEILAGVFDLRVSLLRSEQGELAGTVHVARDISAFKSLERARMLAVHHLSHELKTPLAVIKGSVKDLDDRGLPLHIRQRKVDRIRRSLGRLSEIQGIVQEIVAPRPYRPRFFRVSKALHELLDSIEGESLHRAVAIDRHIDAVETDIIDPGVFTDVVATLTKNAIENTPDQGKVSVELTKEERGVLLQVKDHGMGIPRTDQDYVFAAFHHTQDTEKYATRNPFDFDAGGKGLELMRLKILSEAGGFDINFESERCSHIANNEGHCPGAISDCPYVPDPESCARSGGTTFTVLFKR